MSLFTDAIDGAMTAWFDTGLMADTVSYNSVSIPAHFIRPEIAEELNATGRGERATLHVRVSDVSAPAYRDAVVISTVTWYVLRIVSGDSWTWELELYRDENPLRR
jgi:hypothetical protein